MDPIVVPAPPRSAYNQNRRVSDLLLSQLKHFQHVEKKSGDLGIDPEIARNIHTEAGAANYIAAITTALRDKGSAANSSAKKLLPMPPKRPATKSAEATPVSLAASASGTSSAKNRPAKKAASPKSDDTRTR